MNTISIKQPELDKYGYFSREINLVDGAGTFPETDIVLAGEYDVSILIEGLTAGNLLLKTKSSDFKNQDFDTTETTISLDGEYSYTGTKNYLQMVGDASIAGENFIANVILKKKITSVDEELSSTKIYTDFENKPDGVVSLDTSRNWGIYDNDNLSSGLVVSDGAITHTPQDANSASYLEVELDDKITRIGCKLSFENISYSTSGLVAFCAFSDSIVKWSEDGGDFPDAGIHFLIHPDRVQVTVFEAGASTDYIQNYFFSTALISNQEYIFEIVRIDDKQYLKTHEGLIGLPTEDTRYSTLINKYACWELYESTGSEAPAKIYSIWADDEVTYNYNGLNTIYDDCKLKEYESNYNKSYVVETDPASGEIISLTGSAQIIVADTVRIPESKKMQISATCWFNLKTVGTLVSSVEQTGTTVNRYFETTANSVKEDRLQIIKTLELIGDVGEQVEVSLKMYMAGGSCDITNSATSGKTLRIECIPVP